jgi:hypothetical protein
LNKNNLYVNLDEISDDEAEVVGDKIGEKIRLIMDRACDSANKILKFYDLRIKFLFVVEKIKE